MAHVVGIGHKHCKTCGTCLTAGFTQANHKCLALIRADIWEVMQMDMGTTEDRTRQLNRARFNHEMRAYGTVTGG